MTPRQAPGTSDVAGLLAYDREHLWHPYTSMTNPVEARLVTSAEGVRLTMAGHGEVIDGMSSWWAAIHGYRVPEIDAAVQAQLGQMAHVMFGGLTHEPAVRLAEKLVELTPAGLDKVFLADSGSVSVEVAMKMALQFQRGSDRPERNRFLALRGGYHGDTFHPMSVTDPDGGMHSMWRGVLPEHVFADRPPVEQPEVEAWADSVRGLAGAHAHELAGIIVEPLLQGAGGMWPYHPDCLVALREIADALGLVLIFDEIATGFGRTGELFASDLVTPDVLCLGKALTGGYLSMAAVLTTARIAEGISGSESGVLMHGPTFMGNPLACAIALASIDLLEARGWRDDVHRVHDALTLGLPQLREEPGVADVRILGAVGVVEMDHPVDVAAATAAALEQGVWLRPFGRLIYTMPPYVCTTEEVAQICRGIAAAVKVG